MSTDNASSALLHREEARDLPLVETADVIVAGGGPAGIAAAVVAARAGRRVRLLEVHGCLGGVWTAGLLSWILDADNKQGLMQELRERLDAREARRGKAYDPEVMKLVLEEMCLEAGVDLRLHTRVCAAAAPGADGRATIITESKSGREAWRARCLVDATGDGDLADRLGCGWSMGRPDNGDVQPMSLMVLLTGLDAAALRACGHLPDGKRPRTESKQALRAAMEAAGTPPSYGLPTLFQIHDDLYALMANHEFGVRAHDADGLTAATVRARAEVHRLVGALRAHDPVWSSVRLVATGAQIGVREGRRIAGRYEVSHEDVLEGRRHDDAVCHVTFPVDVHATRKDRAHGGIEHQTRASKPYDIPLRALLARDVDGLLLAGRCLSGDFFAHASYRVTGNAVAMGEAAGACAALASRRGCWPHEVSAAEVTALREALTNPPPAPA